MSTLSVPLTKELEDRLQRLVRLGIVPNKAEAMRQALQKFIDEKAVEAVLMAAEEPSLSGDLDDLAKKL